LLGGKSKEHREAQLKYMVIEMFKPGSKEKVYASYEAKGRMLPDGLKYVDSWLTEDGKRCFQLMETDHPELFNLWIEKWSDLVEFEIIPVFDSPTKVPNMRIQQFATKAPDA
jgi:hypothetical protein